jgi:hypothetical protein
MSVRKLLKEYNKTHTNNIDELEYAQNEMKQFIRKFRKELKECKTEYKFSYVVKNRSWKYLFGDSISHSFEINTFHDSSILKNFRHEMVHKNLFFSQEKPKIEWFKEINQKIQDNYRKKKIQKRSLRVQSRTGVNKNGDQVQYKVCGAVMYQRPKQLKRGESPKTHVSYDKEMIMKLMKSRDKQVIFEEKKPKTKDNYIGIEIEFFCDLDRDDLSYQLANEGLGKYVALHTDGSIQQDAGTFDHEICILAKEKEIFGVVKDVCKVLQDANARVNKSCGLHVHLDMRNRDHKTAFYNLASSQNALFAMNPFSRQAGTYCKRIDTKDFAKAACQDRYFGINAQAYEKHKTIEIRIHSGTIMEDKINNWVKILMAIVNKPEKVEKSASTLLEFVTQFDIDKKLTKYIYERVSKFAGEDKRGVEERGVA